MVGLREQVHERDLAHFVAARQQGREVARQGSGIARHDGQQARPQLLQPLDHRLAQAGAGRIHQHEIRGALQFSQKRLHRGGVAAHAREAGAVQVEAQVAGSAAARFHGRHLAEAPREGQGEQAHAGIEIQGRIPLGALDGRLRQRVHQETVHLEEGVAAHAELAAVIEGALNHSRDIFGAPVEEAAGHRPAGVIDVQLHLVFVGEDFEGLEESRPERVVEHGGEGAEGLLGLGRGDGAGRGGAQLVGARLPVSDLAVLEVELHAVAIAPRFTGDDGDFAGRRDFAQTPQLLHQDGPLGRQLEFVGRVLVVAAATTAENGAPRRHALGRGLEHFERAGLHQAGLLAVQGGADAFAGEHEGSEHNPALQPGETVAPVDQFFHHDFEIAYDRVYSRLPSMRTRVFSGMQPTGNLHIGNYLGALKNWVRIQADYECIFCIVDLHAVTLYQDPAELRAKISETAALYLAAGIDPKICSIMVQSAVPAHAELAWMLTCVTPLGWLERMTQYKAKAAKQESVSDGLLQYPVLMAADILLYQAGIVPVGEDQAQHLELTRDVAQRFNSLYGETFVVPGTSLPAVGARIMGLDDPTQKMSKSATGAGHAVALLDPPDKIRKTIMRATTDSNPGVDLDAAGAGVLNLLTIYQGFSGATDEEIRKEFTGMRYGDLKKQVADMAISHLEPFQQRYRQIVSDPGYLDGVLREGAGRVAPIANATVRLVKERMGLYV